MVLVVSLMEGSLKEWRGVRHGDIPALRRLRMEDGKLETSQGYKEGDQRDTDSSGDPLKSVLAPLFVLAWNGGKAALRTDG